MTLSGPSAAARTDQGGRAPRLGQARGPGAAARSPSSRHSGNLKTATPSPESLPSGDALLRVGRCEEGGNSRTPCRHELPRFARQTSLRHAGRASAVQHSFFITLGFCT